MGNTSSQELPAIAETPRPSQAQQEQLTAQPITFPPLRNSNRTLIQETLVVGSPLPSQDQVSFSGRKTLVESALLPLAKLDLSPEMTPDASPASHSQKVAPEIVLASVRLLKLAHDQSYKNSNALSVKSKEKKPLGSDQCEALLFNIK